LRASSEANVDLGEPECGEPRVLFVGGSSKHNCRIGDVSISNARPRRHGGRAGADRPDWPVCRYKKKEAISSSPCSCWENTGADESRGAMPRLPAKSYTDGAGTLHHILLIAIGVDDGGANLDDDGNANPLNGKATANNTASVSLAEPLHNFLLLGFNPDENWEKAVDGIFNWIAHWSQTVCCAHCVALGIILMLIHDATRQYRADAQMFAGRCCSAHLPIWY
jgi:hypothetical protein